MIARRARAAVAQWRGAVPVVPAGVGGRAVALAVDFVAGPAFSAVARLRGLCLMPAGFAGATAAEGSGTIPVVDAGGGN